MFSLRIFKAQLPFRRFCSSKALMGKFHNSLSFDKRLWDVDIRGSEAFAKELHRSGLLSQREEGELLVGLNSVRKEWENDSFVMLDSDEDIHMANERRLIELIGDSGRKLHTGRSRNDQVATDLRLWCRQSSSEARSKLQILIRSIVNRANSHLSVLMPGYTHLQRAQPIRFSHWILSYAFALQRDCERLEQISERINVLPLGSGALAGNAFKIDRDAIAKDLGFSSVSSNSMDATSDRDFIAELLFFCTLTMTHLSRFAEDLIIYSTKEFGYVSIPEPFSTGSSLMPQKRNPDSLELIRGKSGRIFGNLSGFLMTMKGLPSCYNKDLQEDKEPLFDSMSSILTILEIFTLVIDSFEINEAQMRNALHEEMLATDVAFYLVRRNIPFRTAHGISRQCVDLAESKGCLLSELSLQQFQEIDKTFDADIFSVFDFENAVEQYDVVGGTAKKSVEHQIKSLQDWLDRE
uniref:Arginosuccinase n=1 Tax=Hirondellea gigas TaxID=1518452 RepID=A0A6A7G951_9CRUS